MYEEDLVLNNPQVLICFKTQQNTKRNQSMRGSQKVMDNNR